MSAEPRDWASVLDVLAREARDAVAALSDGGEVEVAPWHPPADLGPVPVELVDRAQEVLALLERVQVEGARRTRALRRQVGEVGTRRDAVTAYGRA